MRCALSGLCALMLGTGCSLDLARLEGTAGGAGGSAPPAVIVGNGDVFTGAGDPGQPLPSEPSMPVAGATCGLVGLPCCRPENSCQVGACLRGECSSFAGAFAQRAGCVDADPCADRNPYSAGCACPEPFLPWTMSPVVAACDDGALAQKAVTVCQSGRTDASGWGGLWLRGAGGSCGQQCLVPNAYTSQCACPSGMLMMMAQVALTQSTCEGANAVLGVCMRAGVTGGRFGGAYVIASGSATGCAFANPDTGQCTCPTGAMEQKISMGSGITVGLCAM